MAAVATKTVVGSHVLTIDGYTRTAAALADGDRIESDVFRVGGHDWYIELSIDRWWVGVHLWLHHDGDQQEVKASPKFTLLNHAGEEIQSHRCYGEAHTFYRRHTDGPALWGTHHFVCRKKLESCLIVDDDGNDCCRIRCDVAVTVIKEPEPPMDPHRRSLGELLLATEVGRDVTFAVGGEEFTAHSCVLAARTSTAFMEKTVLGAGKESAVVDVDGIAPRVFEALLRYIYTDSIPDADEGADDGGRIAVVQGLLAAADRCDMARLNSVCRNLLEATGVGRDVTFVVGEEVFAAHGCVLAARSSPAFMAEVLDAGKEVAVVDGSHHVEVQINGILPGAFRALLHFIYTDSLPDEIAYRDVRATIAGGLLAAADRYDMERLKMACSDKLCSSKMYATTALDTLELAHKHGCLKLNQACVEFIRGKLDAFSLLEETK